MKYRTEIDGLRALAVVPVILFHAGFELFSGGFVGVDVFFVISGYLITTILIDDLENNQFSIVNFYDRRARRILPALFFVMLVCIPLAWMLMLPSQMKDFSSSLIAVSLFVSNVFFWLESGYFAAAAEQKPLLHTWSLSVEEQYYVLFPIFLFLAWRFGKKWVFWMIVIMAAISLALSEWGWRNVPSANFFLTPTRAWELFAGSIAAFIIRKDGVQSNNILSLFGLIAILFAIFSFDKTTPFPSLYSLVPVLGVVLLVLFASKDTIVGKVLSLKPFVSVGLISYSAYLWHQPLFAFARIYTLDQMSMSLIYLLIFLTFLLAYFSYRFIEQPFRKKGNIKTSVVFKASFASSVGLICLAIALPKLFNAAFITPQNQQYISVQSDWNYPGTLVKLELQDAYVHDPSKPIDVLFLGDSHAEQYAPLKEAFAARNSNVAFLTGGGCPPIPSLFDDGHRHCFDIFTRFNSFLEKYQTVKNVVITSCFNCYFIRNSTPREGKVSESDYYFLSGDRRLYFRDGEGHSESLESLKQFLNKLSEKYSVTLIGDNPEAYEFNPIFSLKALYANHEYFSQKYANFRGSSFRTDIKQLELNDRIESIVPDDVKFIDTTERVCPENLCQTIDETGRPLYIDSHHLSAKFVREKFKFIVDKVLE